MLTKPTATDVAGGSQVERPVRRLEPKRDQACKYGDPFCPCQDGDMCHYEGPGPMTPPTLLEDTTTLAAVGKIGRDVRPCAWRWGAKKLRGVEWRYTTSQTRPEAEPLFAKDALDAALNLWPRDCRLCAHFTTQTGGCMSTMQCVDSMQFQATTPRQYWIAGPNVAIKRAPL